MPPAPRAKLPAILMRAGVLDTHDVAEVEKTQRIASDPDVPALVEAGVTGFDASSWQMVVAPACLPRPLLERLNGEIHAIVSDPAFADELSTRGMVALVTPPPDELRAYVKSEIVRWGDVVRRAGAAGSE